MQRVWHAVGRLVTPLFAQMALDAQPVLLQFLKLQKHCATSCLQNQQLRSSGGECGSLFHAVMFQRCYYELTRLATISDFVHTKVVALRTVPSRSDQGFVVTATAEASAHSKLPASHIPALLHLASCRASHIPSLSHHVPYADCRLMCQLPPWKRRTSSSK